MALHLLWVPWDIRELCLLILREECWQERTRSRREAENKPDTAAQVFGATALLCPCSPWITKAFIHISRHSVHAQHLHGSAALAAPMPDTADPGSSISTECTDYSRRALRQELGGQTQNGRRAWPSGLSANHRGATGIDDLPCPENAILREVTLLWPAWAPLKPTEPKAMRASLLEAFWGLSSQGWGLKQSSSPAWIKHIFKTKHRI